MNLRTKILRFCVLSEVRIQMVTGSRHYFVIYPLEWIAKIILWLHQREGDKK